MIMIMMPACLRDITSVACVFVQWASDCKLRARCGLWEVSGMAVGRILGLAQPAVPGQRLPCLRPTDSLSDSFKSRLMMVQRLERDVFVLLALGLPRLTLVVVWLNHELCILKPQVSAQQLYAD